MRVRDLLPSLRGLKLLGVERDEQQVMITVGSSLIRGRCPTCGTYSKRVHSRYWRTLRDLPLLGASVIVRWQTRRFFCGRQSCSQRIFAERLPAMAASHARRTARLAEVVRSIGFVCGGEPGARLAKRLGITLSPDTMLREIRRTAIPQPPQPRVIGVDDWAFQKGHRYGTILIDLERGRPIDLLPQRNAESFQRWLQQHPSVEVVSRDRGDSYIKGASSGAPRARQVADRFHLVANAREALERLLDRHPAALEAAYQASMPTEPKRIESTSPLATTRPMTQADQRKAENQQRRLAQYQRVVELHNIGLSRRTIARRLGLNRSTVARYILAGTFPERAKRRYASATDRFSDYLQKRWTEGCHNASTLLKELRDLGFTASYASVRRRVAKWRSNIVVAKSSAAVTQERMSAKKVSWLFLLDNDRLSDHERAVKTCVCKSALAIRVGVQIIEAFLRILRERRPHSLAGWTRRARAVNVPPDIRRFADGIERDQRAIREACTGTWSNGPTEGHVNRLKLIKRQMYGRGNFDLLRQRVLCPAV